MNDVDDFFRSARVELFPKMKGSVALSITILSANVDPKICMELGAAILFDKPLVIIVPDPETVIPANLKRVASAIVIGNPSDPAIQQQVQDAITAVIENDRRVKQS
jgi:hypothetical protein